jgi:hypothetical protein
LIVLAFIGVMMLLLIPEWVGRWVVVSIFIITLTEEAIGRWQFYGHLDRRIM